MVENKDNKINVDNIQKLPIMKPVVDKDDFTKCKIESMSKLYLIYVNATYMDMFITALLHLNKKNYFFIYCN